MKAHIPYDRDTYQSWEVWDIWRWQSGSKPFPSADENPDFLETLITEFRANQFDYKFKPVAIFFFIVMNTGMVC